MSLTDDWKDGKLKNGWYFCLYENDAVFPALCFDDDFDDYALKVTEVLAPCDFDHFVELTEKVKGLEKDVENLTNNYKLLESKQAVDVAHGQALVDEFGDYEAVYQEITQLRNENRRLRQILKEGYSIIEKNFQQETLAENFARNRWQKSLKILDEIDEVLK